MTSKEYEIISDALKETRRNFLERMEEFEDTLKTLIELDELDTSF